MRRRLWLLPLLSAALASGAAAQACEHGMAPAPPPGPFAPAAALAAGWGADGALALSDGRSLVLLGLALPTALDPQPGLLARSRAAAEMVLDGRLLVPAVRSADRHGRLAGDAVLLPEPGSPADGGSPSLALALLAAGAGYADPGAAPACAAALLAAEAQARQKRRGIFSDPDTVAPAHDHDRLGRRAGLFTLVEGRVRAAGATREKVFLNFGSRWREDFTIVLPAGDFATILGDGLVAAMLRGTLVSVRGVVRMDGGPAIFVRSRHEILILEGPATAESKEDTAR
ncbi:hypothetical protein D9R14_21610 [Xanthobacter tagetidis]|uniref:Nuclease n=2 Tax=Xanthobacter tagetidis TaxID=60216 RepID=A0A3L6ZY77_9HYPH|nr:hypothetical protein D9R14_21610 [Xanthobacter tagetidis]